MQRSIRGATTVDNNDKAEILTATKELISHVLTANCLDISQITNMIFTCTKDLDSVYPAAAARELGITHAALMCFSELHVEGSLPMCIRLMINAEMDATQDAVKHIYLRNAKSLRPDLVNDKDTERKFFQIAIDGPSGVGKSTVAKLCAKELGFAYIDTGAMYRAFAYYCMEEGIDVDDAALVNKAVNDAPIEIKFIRGEQMVYSKGQLITEEIRAQAVAYATSKISAIHSVRERLVAMQQDIAKGHNVIMDGRDIGTVVLKDSPLKIYLDASAEVRAKRRVLELEKLGHKTDYQTILNEVTDRDYRDTTRAEGPLKKADDAIEIICDNMTAAEVCAVICALARKRL